MMATASFQASTHGTIEERKTGWRPQGEDGEEEWEGSGSPGVSMQMVEGCRAVSFPCNLHLQMFKLLARAYADVHPMMMDRSENRCGGNFLKQGSIINGADWYSFTGGAPARVGGWVGGAFLHRARVWLEFSLLPSRRGGTGRSWSRDWQLL